MAQSEKFAKFNKNLCRLCDNTTNTNQMFAIFSDYGNAVKLQRLISDFAKVRVQEDDCFPKHRCRNCYSTLLNLRDKLFAFQTRWATTQINLGKGGETVKRTHQNQALLPRPVVRKGRKESHSNAKFAQEIVIPWWKRKVTFPFNCKWQNRAR